MTRDGDCSVDAYSLLSGRRIRYAVCLSWLEFTFVTSFVASLRILCVFRSIVFYTCIHVYVAFSSLQLYQANSLFRITFVIFNHRPVIFRAQV